MNQSRYLGTSEISEMLGMCYQKTLDFIKYSGIQYVRIGRIYRVRADVLEKFISDNKNINLKEAEYNASIRSYKKT